MAAAAFLRLFLCPVLFPANTILATTFLDFLPGWARADRPWRPVVCMSAIRNLYTPGNPLHEAKHP